MAHFRATIKGQRGLASRLGSEKFGMIASVNGWNIGVHISAMHDKETGKDVFVISKTGGSNGSSNTDHIATIKES